MGEKLIIKGIYHLDKIVNPLLPGERGWRVTVTVLVMVGYYPGDGGSPSWVQCVTTHGLVGELPYKAGDCPWVGIKVFRNLKCSTMEQFIWQHILESIVLQCGALQIHL